MFIVNSTYRSDDLAVKWHVLRIRCKRLNILLGNVLDVFCPLEMVVVNRNITGVLS